MGTIYRSEKMHRCQLFLQSESAYSCVGELGELGLVQFRDLNPEVTSFMRKYVSEVRRCDEMERKLRFVDKEVKRDAIEMQETNENPEAPQPREMVDLEATFEKLDSELREINKSGEDLRKAFNDLNELKHILKKSQLFFDEKDDAIAIRQLQSNSNEQLEYDNPAFAGHDDGATKDKNLNFVVGVIKLDKLAVFERLLWRACRGNIYLKTSPIDETLFDPSTGLPQQKQVFIIFFQGDQLKSRVKKICDGFQAVVYPCPNTPEERRSSLIGILTRIEDLKTVLHQTDEHRRRVLTAAAKNIKLWFARVRKMKSIFHTLNLFNLDVTRKCLIAECWCPAQDIDKIQMALKRGTDAAGSIVECVLHIMETEEAPPTYFKTNKFTSGFQAIVDAYGVASYQEVNPAPFTIISFPFLFAIMFGDSGHGLLMFSFALVLILREKQIIGAKIRDEIFSTFFGGRYIIMLMGLFSIYTGLIYNDIFSRSFNIFGSNWKVNESFHPYSMMENAKKVGLDPLQGEYLGGSYPFGFDPVWQFSENKLLFLNSFKMKMSVIIGITQMTFGVILSLMNHRYFKEPMNIICEFIPQMLFLSCIFVYLCVMVIVKWLLFGAAPNDVAQYSGSHCAPSLLISLINMFMLSKQPEGLYERKGQDPNCGLYQFYSGQYYIQSALVVVAVLSIPWMLIPKPFFIRSQHRKKLADALIVRGNMHDDNVEILENGKTEGQAPGSHGGGHGAEEEFSFGDIFIHQSIHTIEFCLGCISHTASYLRLWALSLAHAELSEVLWNMVLVYAFKIMPGYIGVVTVYIVFAVFAALTVAILIVMEGLSAFLHALRLHWVEFNSKFYHGEGYAFAPFSFDVILEEMELEMITER